MTVCEQHEERGSAVTEQHEDIGCVSEIMYENTNVQELQLLYEQYENTGVQ